VINRSSIAGQIPLIALLVLCGATALLTIDVPTGAPAARAVPVELPRNGRQSHHPAWPPFTGPTERRAPAYIAFADRDHLVSYLRQRAEADLD